jgi:hypothetical protein
VPCGRTEPILDGSGVESRHAQDDQTVVGGLNPPQRSRSSDRPAVDLLTPETARAIGESVRIPEQVDDDAANLSMLKLYWRRTGNSARHEFLRWVNGVIEAKVA